MIPRLRRFLDIRPGEGLPVLLTFVYIAVVVASFQLAKATRSGLFLQEYSAYELVYVYAAVPVVLSLFMPAYGRFAVRFGSRSVTIGTLVFFSLNVLLFWSLFRVHPFPLLTGIFFVWVNCFGVIAPVQAWSFANSLFDSRQAKRLFGLIGSGASLGAIAGGMLARLLVKPVGGAINLLFVLAVLILAAAGVFVIAHRRLPRKSATVRIGGAARQPSREILQQIAHSPYLRLLAALAFLSAIVTQWVQFQFNGVVKQQFGSQADAMTQFFGTFTFVFGTVGLLVQLFGTSRALRRFGVAATVLALPLALGFGSFLIVLITAFWPVVITYALDQSLRFSIDKPTYELLYLPIPPPQRVPVKHVIDIVIVRIADAFGAVVIGVVTAGFLMLPGFGLDLLHGTAALNLGLIAAWILVAWRLRSEYVRTIQESIHRHRIDTERTSAAVLERSAAETLKSKLTASDPAEVRYALSLLEVQHTKSWHPALRSLLQHADAEIRRRALALLSAAGDREIAQQAVTLLRDRDLGVRTEALLYLTREMGIDPLQQIEKLGDFEDFSIRAGMTAFLASPGPAQNLEAARALLEAMTHAPGADGVRERAEAARLIALVPDAFLDLLAVLISDEDEVVARQAVRSARVINRDELIPALIGALARPELVDEACGALAKFGNAVVPEIASRMTDESLPIDIRRELPSVLVQIGTVEAEQVLIESLLQADVTLRHRVVTSLDRLRVLHPEVRLDPNAIELLLAAEIAGHYRSYQVLGPLQARLPEDDAVLQAMRHSMEQELERIFRLMALLFPHAGPQSGRRITDEALHDAYVGVRSSNRIVRANALELLDNVLKPELRQVLAPLLDSQVTVAERIALANRLVGAPVETTEQAIGTMLASEDAWLRSCAVYAIGALQITSLAGELRQFESSPDPVLKENVRTARRRLAGEPESVVHHEPAPAAIELG
jgi:AAA family ATP:ADP antiporter